MMLSDIDPKVWVKSSLNILVATISVATMTTSDIIFYLFNIPTESQENRHQAYIIPLLKIVDNTKSHTMIKIESYPFREGTEASSPWLCLVERLPSGLHSPAHHGSFVTMGTDSVRSKLPQLRVLVSPSPVSREGGRDFVVLDRPVVFKPRPSLWTHPLVSEIKFRFNVHVHLKTNFIFPILETRRDGSDGGSV